jgi:hypothetical protein
MQETWINGAALYEVLSLAFLYPNETLADSLISGEYGEALDEILALNKVSLETQRRASGELDVYRTIH